MKKKSVGLIICVLILCSFALNTLANSFSKIYKNSYQSIFLISNEEVQGDNKVLNYGTAFAIDSRGTLVTVAHLCKDGALVTSSDGRVYPILDTLWIDEQLDLAVIKVAGKFQPLDLEGINNIQVGDEITVISNPSGFQNTLSTGVLSAKRQDQRELIQLQHTSPISPGSSGAPLFNNAGQVVGVVQGIYASENSQNLNFAIPVEYIPAKYLSQNHDLIAYQNAHENASLGNISEKDFHESNFIESKVSLKDNSQEKAEDNYLALIDDFNQLISLEKNNFQAYLMRAIFRAKMGDLNGVKSDLERAKRIIDKSFSYKKTAAND